MNNVVSVKNLRKSYQKTEVLRGVDLLLQTARTYFLVGPNGCGKTTTIETIVGLRKIQQGTVSVLGTSPKDPALRAHLRVCLQGAALHPQVTVLEHFCFLAALYNTSKQQIYKVASEFGVSELLNRRFGHLSGGQKKRVMVASTLFGDAKLIILDEPTSGVDLESRLSLWSCLRGAVSGRDTALLVTTHDLNEAEAYADEVIIMREGKIKAAGTVDRLIEDSGLLGTLPLKTSTAKKFLESTVNPDRHLLSQDHTTTVLGYTSRRALLADLQKLADKNISARERSVRLMDAYLFTYRGSFT